MSKLHGIMSKLTKIMTEQEWNAEYKQEVELFGYKDIVTPTCVGLQSANSNLTKVRSESSFFRLF